MRPPQSTRCGSLAACKNSQRDQAKFNAGKSNTIQQTAQDRSNPAHNQALARNSTHSWQDGMGVKPQHEREKGLNPCAPTRGIGCVGRVVTYEGPLPGKAGGKTKEARSPLLAQAQYRSGGGGADEKSRASSKDEHRAPPVQRRTADFEDMWPQWSRTQPIHRRKLQKSRVDN